MCHKSNFTFWFVPQRSCISVAQPLQLNDISVKISEIQKTDMHRGTGYVLRGEGCGVRVARYEFLGAGCALWGEF